MSDSFLDAVRATDAYRRGVAAARAALAAAKDGAAPGVDNVNTTNVHIVNVDSHLVDNVNEARFSEWEPSTAEEWAGKARMAEARRAVGVPLSPADRKALRRVGRQDLVTKSAADHLDLGGVA